MVALYRKYRPKTLDDFMAQDDVVGLLRNAAAHNRFSHAYLFYGGRGSGKTSMARQVAKLLNCTTRLEDAAFFAKAQSCNHCVNCQEIDAGNSLDVIEIDAASNRGIDEMRNLKETIATSPAKSTHKIFIVDEAHMLTPAAFNALLKTLEEPPAHGVIILATTDYEKLPATIVSRTQRFYFRKIPRASIAKHLAFIAKQEQISIEPAALDTLAAASGGSFRDALSLLDQAHNITGGVITVADVTTMLGTVAQPLIHAFSRAIITSNTKEALRIVSELFESGANLVGFIKAVIGYLRSALTLQLNPDMLETLSVDFTDEQIGQLQELAGTAQADVVVHTLRQLLDTYMQMRTVPFARAPLEIFIAQLSKK